MSDCGSRSASAAGCARPRQRHRRADLLRRAAAGFAALALCLGGSRGAADVVPPTEHVRRELIFVSVDGVSSTAPAEDTARVHRQANAALRGNTELFSCLGRVRVGRGPGSVSAIVVFDRAREPEVSVATRGAVPAAGRRCVETAARAIWLRAAPEGRVTLRARFEVATVHPSHSGERPTDRPFKAAGARTTDELRGDNRPTSP